MKTLKNRPQKLLIIGPIPFFHRPAQTTAHSPELIFHIMKSRDQTSVLLSVIIMYASKPCRQVKHDRIKTFLLSCQNIDMYLAQRTRNLS